MRLTSFYPILLLFLIGNVLITNAQQDFVITDFDRLIEENTSQNRSQQSFDTEEIENLRNLVFDLNPLLFINKNGHKKMGEGAPKLIIVQSSELAQLTSLNSELENVTLILIKHSSTNAVAALDLNSIKTPSLKYVLIECDFQCSVSNIQNMLQNTSNVKVLYRTTTEQ